MLLWKFQVSDRVLLAVLNVWLGLAEWCLKAVQETAILQ